MEAGGLIWQIMFSWRSCGWSCSCVSFTWGRDGTGVHWKEGKRSEALWCSGNVLLRNVGSWHLCGRYFWHIPPSEVRAVLVAQVWDLHNIRQVVMTDWCICLIWLKENVLWIIKCGAKVSVYVCVGDPWASNWQTFARLEATGCRRPVRPARYLQGHVLWHSQPLQPFHQPGSNIHVFILVYCWTQYAPDLHSPVWVWCVLLYIFSDFSFHLLILSLPIQVPAKTDCVMCFGPVVPDGYGVCYNPMEKHINFAVSAFNSCADTNATRLTQALEDALLDMKNLLDQKLKSKLWGQRSSLPYYVAIMLKYLREHEVEHLIL